MPGWTLVDTHPTQGRVFRRPLGAPESVFFWNGLFNGTNDLLQHFELRLEDASRDAHLFSEVNILRAWVSTKRRYPLAGAIVQGQGQGIRVATGPKAEGDGGDDDDGTGFTSKLHFIVRERALSLLRPREVIFGRVADAEEAQQKVASLLDGPRPLSENLLAQLYVFRETNSERARADVLHLVTLMGHCVTDEIANRAFMRCLIDTLARGGRADAEPAQMPLEDRLAMAVPAVELEPTHLRVLSPAKRRWRKAIGAVIFDLRMAKGKGGHTLPCRLKRSTASTPARPGQVSISLTHAQSAAVIANCRQYGLTFGNAYLVLAQVAMTRVLYRRYLRGEISEEEWTYRKRQPYINVGPINLRPHLDEAWFEGGGGGEFMASTSARFFRLPCMTLGGTDECCPELREHETERVLAEDGAPPFSDLLTFDRFLHRVGLVKKQGAGFFGHPLFFEIMHIMSEKFVERQRLNALQWMRRVEAGTHDDNLDEDDVLAVTDIPMIQAHGGSSLGNMDPIFPSEYPLPPTHPLSPYSPVSHPTKAGYVVPPAPLPPMASDADAAPKVVVECSRTRLHTRPGLLYLGAATERKQLNLYVYYDGNVFEEGVVKEWLDEVRGAVVWYLGRAGHSGDAQAKQRGLGQGTRAKWRNVY